MSGGKRKGAGRKPLPPGQKAVGVTVRVRPEIAARFAAWCAAKGISQASAFAAWVRRQRRADNQVSHQGRSPQVGSSDS
jgi:hypothetical protein